MSKTPEMVELRKAVEEKYKKPLRTTTDFERFTHKMEKEYGEQISTATMKRLWDYVSDQHKPRESTSTYWHDTWATVITRSSAHG